MILRKEGHSDNADFLRHMMNEKKAKSILGEEFFDGLKNFYRSLKENKQYQYRVLLVRRSYVLYRIFREFECGAEEEFDIEEFITDNALISQCPNIVQYYMANKVFPAILIADDILIHGRAINAFLVKLEQQLIRELGQLGCEDDDIKIRTELTRAVSVRVYMKNDKPSVLLARYQTRVKCERIDSAVVWRDLSNRVAILVSQADMANASFTPSAVASGRIENEQSLDFRKIETFYRGNRQIVYLRFLDFGEGIKSIYTVRTSKRCGNNKRYIPYVLLPELSSESMEWLMEQITVRLERRGIKTECIKNWKSIYRTRNEFVSMVLSWNMMFIFWNKTHKIQQLIPEKKEICKMAHNYGNQPEIYNVIDFIIKNPLFSAQELETLLEHATSKAKILYEGSIPFEEMNEDRRIQLLDIMEDEIGSEGLEAERQAHILRTHEYIPTELQYKEARVKVSDFWRKIRDVKPEVFSIEYAIAYMLQFMDMGIMVISMHKSQESDCVSCKQYVKAGEQSLMLEALNLYEFIPLLDAIETKCEGDFELIAEQWEKYIQKEQIPQDKADKVKRFLCNLQGTGRKARDWRFNMINLVFRDYDKAAEEDQIARIKRIMALTEKQTAYVQKYLG